MYQGKKWGEVGDGMHNITRYGEKETDAYRRASLGVVWRNWHPGPLGFQVVADMFALAHIAALRSAIESIKSMTKSNGGVAKTADFDYFKRPIMANELPAPVYCKANVCKVEDAPGCLNLEEPTYGYHQVSIVPPDDALNPYKGKAQKYSMLHD